MSSDGQKQIKVLCRKIQKLRPGWTIERARHVKIKDETGRVVAITAISPSDHRAVLNFRSDLRKRGLDV